MVKKILLELAVILSTFMLFDCNGVVFKDFSDNSKDPILLQLVPPNQSKGVSSQVNYYTTQINPPAVPFTRSLAPSVITSGGTTESQVINTDGSVSLSITNMTAYSDCGFYKICGTLGTVNGIHIETAPGSDPISINLWFDRDNNGDFFVWTGDVFTGLGADAYILGASSVSGVVDVNDATLFSSLNPGGGNYTLGQLKSGSAPGISSTTRIAVWVGFSGPPPANMNATIRMFSIY